MFRDFVNQTVSHVRIMYTPYETTLEETPDSNNSQKHITHGLILRKRYSQLTLRYIHII